MFMNKGIIIWFLVLASAVICAILRSASPGTAAEKLVGLQSAPSIAMALPLVRRGSAAPSKIRP